MEVAAARPWPTPLRLQRPLAGGTALDKSAATSSTSWPGPRTAASVVGCVVLAAAGRGKKAKLAPSKFKPAGKFDLDKEKKNKVRKKKQELFEVQYEAGAIAPLYAWDPAQFISKAGGEAAMKESFFRLRSAELKHGRVAMLAVVGAVVQHYVHLPMFDGMPKGLGVLSNSIALFGFCMIILLAGYLEIVVLVQDTSKRAGSFGDPAGIAQMLNLEDGADNLDMQNKELSNGRLAMVGMIITGVAEKVYNLDAVEQINEYFFKFLPKLYGFGS